MGVACIDKHYLGGTCLNVGCIPSKALLESSEIYSSANAGFDAHGIGLGEVDLDLSVMMNRKEKIVSDMTNGIKGLFERHGVTSITGTAKLLSGNELQVDSAEGTSVVTANQILIATGSVPVELPNIPFDGNFVISSTEALKLDSVPERLAVIGAGAIGLEMGSVWSRLGAEVKIIEYTNQIVPGMDKEMASQLQRVLSRQGMNFELNTGAKSVVIDENGVKLELEENSESKYVECDRVLVAVGRRPYTAGLGIVDLGVKLDDRGYVVTDSHGRTSLDGVWAIGDVVTGPMLAHKAEAEGIAVVERMAGLAGRVNYDAIPGVVYTHPELASVGLTEETAKSEGHRVSIGKIHYRANARAHCMEETDGLVKVIANAETDRLLGIHILGAHASSMIAESVLALEFSASAEDLARTIHAHPALSEIVKEAAWEASF
jgi:dihydrolipoamide dehydrogenase